MKIKAVLFILLTAVIITANPQRPRLSPWDAWRMAYTSFEKGEEFRDKGEYTKAKESFDSALEYYNMVRESRPDWNQRVISERIADCQKESRRMSAFLGVSAKKNPVPEPEIGRAVLSKMEEKLSKELSEFKAEVEELRRRNETRKNYEGEITNLMRDLRILNERYALLEKRYRAQSEKLSLPDQNVRDLESQLVALRLQLDLARKESAAAKQSAAAAAAERNALRSEKNAADIEKRKLSEEIKELNRKIEENANALAQFEKDKENGLRKNAELEKVLADNRSSNARLSRELEELQGKYREKLAAAGAGSAANKKLLEENKRLQESNNTLRKKEMELSQQKDKFQRESENLKRDLADEKSRSAKNNARIKEQLSRIDSLNSELAREKSASAIINRELESIRSTNSSNAAELKKLSSENADLKKRLKFRESEDFKNMTAARSTRDKLQEELRKQEDAMVKLRTELKMANEKIAAMERSHKEMQSENRKLHANRINYEDRLKALSGISTNTRELARKYAELQANFKALQAENRQNKLAADAAKPREAELARIKLRLAELDGLKQQLRREQSFNEQLNGVKNRLEQELRKLRPMGEENANLKARLNDYESLKKEVERFRKLSKELADGQKLSVQVAELKVQVAKLAPEAAEAEKLRRQNRELIQGKVLWENEIAKMKTRLASQDQLEKQNADMQKEAEKRSLAYQNAGKEIEQLNTRIREMEKQLAAFDKLRASTRQMAEDQAGTIERLRKTEEELRRCKAELALSAKGRNVDTSGVPKELETLRKEYVLLKSVNEKNVNLEQNLADMRILNNRMRNELEQLRPLRSELKRIQQELDKRSAELGRSKKETDRLLVTAEEGRRIAAENSRILKINKELSDRSLKAESDLAAAKSELAELDRLRKETERLRKLSQELAAAKALAPQLAQAKLRIAHLEQMREELTRQRILNEELTEKNNNLQKELASRPMPAFAPADYVPAGALTNPVGKAEDYIAAAKLAAADDKMELAIWNCRAALKLAPDNGDAAEYLGRLLAQQGAFAEAAPLLSRARNSKPDSIELAIETANAYIALRRFGNADAIIAPLLKRNQENPHLLTAAALIAAGNSEYARATGLLRLAAARLPNDPRPRMELARLLHATDSRRVFEAVKLYESARRLGAAPDLELEPKLAPLLNKRRNMSAFLTSAAREAARNKDWNSVIWYNRQLIDLDREPEKYRPRLAFAQYKKGSSGAALETLSMGSSTPLSLLLKAYIHKQRREEREALQALQQAKIMNNNKMIEIPAEWSEFVVEFRQKGREFSSFAR